MWLTISATTAVLRPKTKTQLKSAVDKYCKSSNGLCDPNHPDGDAPINDWDVSEVTDMDNMFYQAKSFNDDISKWDVSKMTTMQKMFIKAVSFNSNISHWGMLGR